MFVMAKRIKAFPLSLSLLRGATRTHTTSLPYIATGYTNGSLMIIKKRPYSNSYHATKDIDFDKLLENIKREKALIKETVDYNEKEKEEEEEVSRYKRKEVFTLDELVHFLREKSARDICVITVPPSLRYVTYFVTCMGTSSRHIASLAESLALEMKHVRILNGQRVIVEGSKSEEWLAVDIGHSVVHFMTESMREKYQLEKLWSLGWEHDEQMQEILTLDKLNDEQ